ncbi:MAG: bifunctional riboflavin kinase/FAD synthetase [Candidatus Sumerlaeia bacterium]|nr:bifunctional riboflavin kinase/FAD synthetase [Candidatus Sumerlaeia bacterium]
MVPIRKPHPAPQVTGQLTEAASLLAGRPTVCCIGVFDGVHLGHQRLIRSATDEARAGNLACIVLTFRNHPLSVLAPAYAPLLLTDPREKARQLAALCPSLIVLMEFTQELADIEPESFIEHVLVGQLHAVSVWCGADFRFGRQGRGDLALLAEAGQRFGLVAHSIKPVSLHGQIISSTRIRALLEHGDVAQAAECLGRPYRLSGQVVKGHGRGRRLGYPTANVSVPPGIVVPGNGIYAVAAIAGTQRLTGVMHVGPLPTFGVTERRLEVFLFEYSGDLMGQTIEVECVARLRDVRRFDSPDHLVAQIQADIEAARAILREK